MPSMRPEPFLQNNIQTNVENIGSNDIDYTESEALYAENQSSAPTSGKRRPPASFSVGKPQRPLGLTHHIMLKKYST